jgi:hypothetical protein
MVIMLHVGAVGASAGGAARARAHSCVAAHAPHQREPRAQHPVRGRRQLQRGPTADAVQPLQDCQLRAAAAVPGGARGQVPRHQVRAHRVHRRHPQLPRRQPAHAARLPRHGMRAGEGGHGPCSAPSVQQAYARYRGRVRCSGPRGPSLCAARLHMPSDNCLLLFCKCCALVLPVPRAQHAVGMQHYGGAKRITPEQVRAAPCLRPVRLAQPCFHGSSLQAHRTRWSLDPWIPGPAGPGSRLPWTRVVRARCCHRCRAQVALVLNSWGPLCLSPAEDEEQAQRAQVGRPAAQQPPRHRELPYARASGPGEHGLR